jgi:hypothetical protein
MSGILDLAAWKSHGVFQFGWKLAIDIDSPGCPSMPAGLRQIRELRRAWGSSAEPQEARGWLTVVTQSEATEECH